MLNYNDPHNYRSYPAAITPNQLPEYQRQQQEKEAAKKFGESLLWVDPTKDVKSQLKPSSAKLPPTTDTYNYTLFGKEIKIPKNIVYPIIGIVLVLILILALRR